MVFYKIEALKTFEYPEEKNIREAQRALCCELAEKTEYFFQTMEQKNIVLTVCIKDGIATFAAITQFGEDINKVFMKYEKLLPFDIEQPKIEETTFGLFQSMLNSSERNRYINEGDDILSAFGIMPLTPRHSNCNFGESLIDTQKRYDELQKVANNALFSGTLNPEIDRIYEVGNLKNVQGHPVQYMVRTDDREVRKAVYKALLSALYNNGRIKNQRYSFVDYNEYSRMPGSTLEALYNSSEGGAVVVRFTEDGEDEDEFGSRTNEIISAICEIAVAHKQKVLTIICLPNVANKTKEEFLYNWGNTSFIELYEDVVFGENACNYLKSKAKKINVRTDKKLINCIEEDKGYTAAELNTIFDNWYQKKLKNEIYPQYKTASTAHAKVKKEQSRGSSYGKLQSLIGLESAKEVMNIALNYFKAQKLFEDKGLKSERPSMHMVFTGNPGTAKTTVARLFAEIMKDNKLLETGKIYEVGRADLVGKYVGHTAPLVKAAFRRARGGVLFIDEAYSLVDDRDGLFGDEAINTIVQEMENNREDTVVIFAGYPDKMEGFLNKNPGLRSRIAFHIPFEDYNASELCDIAELIATEKGFHIAETAREKLSEHFDNASKRSDFGNGRYARNVIERAKMAQANRLMNMDLDNITKQDVLTLEAEDFEFEDVKTEKALKIGFCA